MKLQLESVITATIKDVFGVELTVELARPDEAFGDFATNSALQLSKQLGKNPRQIAETLAEALRERLEDTVVDISIAGPGFLNLRMQDAALLASAGTAVVQSLAGKVVVVEYSDPNPFKVLHAGHLYTSVVGDAIANLQAVAGAEVHRVNFGGDVGLHVGKTLWAILQRLGGEQPAGLADIPEAERSSWMAAAYVEGTNAYEDDPEAKAAITQINKRVYGLHAEADHDSAFAQIYWTCREWSYAYFDAFYARIGTTFEKYYPESMTAPVGLRVVQEQLASGVYEKSDGAVVFKGEPYGLHTRVFINSEGLPTYEAKDVGLLFCKRDDYHFDKSIIITGNEQSQYMAVVYKSIEQFAPELTEVSVHLTHGLVKLQGGVKMSSRKGNFLRAVDVLDAASEANKTLSGKDDQQVVLGAVKYAFLKNRTGGDIIYDPVESVSIEGNSGPYLQYAHARARSILAKRTVATSSFEDDLVLQPGERSLVLKLTEYSEIVDKAVSELFPHIVCTYLYELAQNFNRFYENNRVIGDSREHVRARLVEVYADTLQAGLSIMGIASPDKM